MERDNRREKRTICHIPAKIMLGMGQPPIDAQISDISERGLRLSLPDTSGIPDEFTLYIPRRHMTERVSVRHRTENTLGCIIKRKFL